jgi:hypothetical protein
MISGITFIIHADSQEFGMQSNSIIFSRKYTYEKITTKERQLLSKIYILFASYLYFFLELNYLPQHSS